MELDKQVVSLDLAVKLKELGIKQDSVWYWVDMFLDDTKLGLAKDGSCWIFDTNFYTDVFMTGGNPTATRLTSAFTVAELGELLPELCLSGKANEVYYNCWRFEEMCLREVKHYNTFQSHKEADAKATMLIWLIEKGEYDVAESKDGG